MLSVAAASERLFDVDGVDCPRRALEIVGDLPRLPKATWYLNGPGRFHLGAYTYSHWLDGDGLVRALWFDGSRITFASRFVRTRKFVDEEAAGRPLYRTFGSAFNGDRLNVRQTGLETPANVCIVAYDRRLLALGEQGEPYEIDPATLDTIGPFTAAGAITAVTPFAAHAKVDPASGEMFNFGVSFSAANPALYVYRLDSSGRLARRGRIALDAPVTIHDFALGPTKAVFYVSPYVLDVNHLRRGGSIVDALCWRPELGSCLIVVDRDSCEPLLSVPIGHRYCLHTINAYEIGSALVVDVVEMPAPVYDTYRVPHLFDRPVAATPVRFTIDLDGRTVSRRELRGGFAPEFAIVDAADVMRPYSYFWALDMSGAASAAGKFFDCLTRFSWDTGEAETYRAPVGVLLGGEPVVVSDTTGGRWTMCQMFDAARERTGFAVFDAFALGRGPVAQLWLDVASPMPFHGLLLPSERQERE